MSNYVFFWGGPFSQWAKSPFTIGGVRFNTCEQYMMYKKALLFDDTETALEILKTTYRDWETPQQLKSTLLIKKSKLPL